MILRRLPNWLYAWMLEQPAYGQGWMIRLCVLGAIGLGVLWALVAYLLHTLGIISLPR